MSTPYDVNATVAGVADALIGVEDDAGTALEYALDRGVVALCAEAAGAMEIACDLTLDYLKERKQFGQPLADFQALQFSLADMATELESARLMIHRAAWMLDNGMHGTTVAAAMAKRVATDTGFEVVNQALQLHGGYGYLREFPIQRYLRDLRVHQILEGTNEIMRVIISRDILRQ